MSVYFATSCGFTKIGYSADPIRRIATITRLGLRPDEIPYDAAVDLIGWIPGDTWREQLLHAQHIDNRVKGEWFRLDLDHIRDLIWSDPCGVDINRMSAAAVFTLLNSSPGTSRADVEAAGVPLLARPLRSGAVA